MTKKTGIGLVAVKNSGHYGLSGYYAEQAVRKNLITLIFTNAPPAVAPYGALKTLGVAGTAYGIYDTGVAYKEGISGPEMAARFIGADPIYREIREYSRLTPEAQTVQKKLKSTNVFLMQQ